MNTHPLLEDRWLVHGEPEHGMVMLAHIHQIDRGRHAIETIARMVSNSAVEPDESGTPELDTWTITCRLGGVESLCAHVGDLTEQMLDRAASVGSEEDQSEPS